MHGDALRLTLIIPAFNEARRLSERAERLCNAAAQGSLDEHETEVIVVDDGSTDLTGRRAEELLAPRFSHLRVLRLHNNSGKGTAVRLGIAAASAPIVVFMDADMAVDPCELPRLVKAIGPADVAIGSRALSDSVVEASGLHRQLMGRSFNALVNMATRVQFRDTQCGFKAFRTPLARLLFHLTRIQGFAFDVEVLSLARQLRMQISEVAVHWCGVSGSTVRTLVDPLSMTRDVLGTRRGRRRPNIPALDVTPVPGERRRSQSRVVGELYQALGPNYPLLLESPEHSLVLLPLCDPIEVQRIAGLLRHLSTQLTVRERSVSFDELADHSPFSWIDGTDDGLVVASRMPTRDLVTRAPLEGWESLRSSGRCSRKRVGA